MIRRDFLRASAAGIASYWAVSRLRFSRRAWNPLAVGAPPGMQGNWATDSSVADGE